jgi:hypothetical protein
MGGALNGPGLSGNHGSSLCLAKPNDQHQVSRRGLHWISEDERTVRTACLKPVCRIGPYTAEGFQRTGARRISSWPGDFNLHKQAGYIDADFPLPSTFPLQSDGGPYISETSHSDPAPNAGHGNDRVWAPLCRRRGPQRALLLVGV